MSELIDQKKAKNMCMKIIMLEKDNTKNKEYSEREMQNKIREIIETEAE